MYDFFYYVLYVVKQKPQNRLVMLAREKLFWDATKVSGTEVN